MSKYKLIKEYPASMSVGTIVKKVSGGYMSDNLIFFFREYIENNPEFWEKINEPILRTDDGIDLYQNDTFWHVDTYFCVNKGILSMKPGVFKPIKGYKHFSTEKAAKDWIDFNKPKYSMNDIINASTTFGCPILDGYRNVNIYKLNGYEQKKELK